MIRIQTDHGQTTGILDGTPAEIYTEASCIVAVLVKRLAERFNMPYEEVGKIIGKPLAKMIEDMEDAAK